MGVASMRLALKWRPGASPAPARATTPSGRWVPGRLGSGSTQDVPGRQLGADPVGLVGQGDQVGISFAGGVDLVGLGGLDDLRKQRACRSPGVWLRREPRRRRCGRRRSGAASSWGRLFSRRRDAAAQFT